MLRHIKRIFFLMLLRKCVKLYLSQGTRTQTQQLLIPTTALEGGAASPLHLYRERVRDSASYLHRERVRGSASHLHRERVGDSASYLYRERVGGQAWLRKKQPHPCTPFRTTPALFSHYCNLESEPHPNVKLPKT